MMRVLILGAGGHAQVVADILSQMHAAGEDVMPIGYLDDDLRLAERGRLGLPIWGRLHDLSAIAHDAVIIGIGDNQIRRALFAELSARGENLIVARHIKAIIAPDVSIGPGSMICAGAIVNTGSIIGSNVILNTGCTVDHHNQIGDHVHIAPGVHTGGAVIIGEGALVGIGAAIMPYRVIGPWATVGAGSLVSKDIPAHVVAVGSPARVIRRISP